MIRYSVPLRNLMHELAVTQSILDITLRHAEKAGAQRIIAINLAMGKLSTVVDDSVQFYWDMMAEGTIAKGAKLNFARIPTEMRCFDCGHTFEPDDRTFECPFCQSQRVHVSKGEELRVESIDVE
jgi:hydrogenase nickel incorporation protein HypA/HybF